MKATESRPAVQACDLYLDLLKKTLTRLIFPEQYAPYAPRRPLKVALFRAVESFLAKRNLAIVSRFHFDATQRTLGKDWPPDAETMVGLKRLDNLQSCVSEVVARNVPGDFIETGAWRGGASIFMRACLAAFGDTARLVWVADSFEGLPKPDEKYAADCGDNHWKHAHLAVSLEQVRDNFARYGMLDDRVRFLKGWFKDTLPSAPISRLSILRLDGDMYESTIQALDALYPKLSLGGFCIVDDYALPGCREAITDYRRDHHITEPIQDIDGAAAFWRRA